MQVAARTDVGRVRKRNEDDLVIDEERGLFLVADGLGGHAAGDVASRTGARAAHGALAASLPDTTDPARSLSDALLAAHDAVLSAASQDPALAGMGTTAVLALLSGDELWVAHVGDSRAYLSRAGELRRLTNDHRAGGVFGNRLSQALGTGGDVLPDTLCLDVSRGDRVLLCTDGLTDMLGDDAIAARLGSGEPPQDVCTRLVDDALAAGGVDNITVVLVEV